jgi:hypothetical protein
MKQGIFLEQESKEAGLASLGNPQWSASSNKPQTSSSKPDQQATKKRGSKKPQ